MNKAAQAILLTVVILIGTGARLSVPGWLFIFIPIGIGTILIFGVFHFWIHYKSMTYLATNGHGNILKLIISHLLFLCIFLFQLDAGDDRVYSILGHIIGVNSAFLTKYGFYIVGISLVGYFIINYLIIKEARKQKKESNLKYLIPSLIGSIFFPIIFVNVFYLFKDFQKIKNIEMTGEFRSVKRAMKNPGKVIAVIINSSQPNISDFPIEILKLPNLKIIELNKQNIEIIPDEIIGVQNLEVLNLIDNNIKEIPSSICNCIQLKELRIGGDIQGFPDCLKKMKNLKHLSIQSNTANELMDELREFEYLETAHFYLKGGNGVIFEHNRWWQIKKETGIKHKY